MGHGGSVTVRGEDGWVRVDAAGNQEVRVPPLREIIKNRLALYLYILFLPLAYGFVLYDKGSYVDRNLNRIADTFSNVLWIISGLSVIAFVGFKLNDLVLVILLYAIIYQISLGFIFNSKEK